VTDRPICHRLCCSII